MDVASGMQDLHRCWNGGSKMSRTSSIRPGLAYLQYTGAGFMFKADMT